jgi:hypothetical protein
MDTCMNTVYVKFSRFLFTVFVWRIPNGSAGRNKLLFHGDRVLYGYRGTWTSRGKYNTHFKYLRFISQNDVTP